MYPSQEATVGKFASAIHLNSEVYIIGYLNCLIHNILLATGLFKKFVMMTEDKFYEENYSFGAYQRDYTNQIPKPTLISFIKFRFDDYILGGSKKEE